MGNKLWELLAKAEERFNKAGIEEGKTDAFLLWEFASGMNRTSWLLHKMDELDQSYDKAVETYEKLVQKRCLRIPLQQLTGSAAFCGFDFYVNSDVLIPRFDTEILVEEGLKQARQIKAGLKEGEPLSVLDVCTGSGCIAISIEKLLPFETEVTGVDLSAKALEVARKNGKLSDSRAEFIESDVFSGVMGKRYHMILSNPHYIPSGDIDGLMEEVRDHEPRMALDGDADGLKFYRKICEEAGSHLETCGRLLFEIGCDQGEAVGRLMEQAGFTDVRITKDLAGLDRVVSGILLR